RRRFERRSESIGCRRWHCDRRDRCEHNCDLRFRIHGEAQLANAGPSARSSQGLEHGRLPGPATYGTVVLPGSTWTIGVPAEPVRIGDQHESVETRSEIAEIEAKLAPAAPGANWDRPAMPEASHSTESIDTTADVETPEHVRFEYHLAGPAKRATAY